MPTNSPRPDPVIPDHEVLRKVGGGAYGEVWLARGVTGALRAVKVVYREDFDDERSFEREFEGILKFEPISRDHPGMVNILHVGRSPDSRSFYYYVMELGDDVVSGRDINPVEYEARTLRSDTKRTPGRRLATDHCIDVGLRLAEALKHLHDHELAHRDVKPANVIFVGGRAKLADIGLVATRGQRTFVGTEGFVPPEGPGSAQADVYSLGKVLYEIATGKDRLDFPELPDELPVGGERKRWLALNQIICDICEPQLSKRKISSAGELSEALRRLQQGKRRRRRRPVGAFFGTLFIGGILSLGAWTAFKDSAWVKKIAEVTEPDPPPPPPPRKAYVKILSTPDGADVYDLTDAKPDEPGIPLKTTPIEYATEVGREVIFRLEKQGHSPKEIRGIVPESAAVEPYVMEGFLKVDSPPVINEPWFDQLNQKYRVAGAGHELIDVVGEKEWQAFAKDRADRGASLPKDAAEFIDFQQNGRKRRIALTSRGYAREFCFWLATDGNAKGFLNEKFEMSEVMVQDFDAPGMSERARRELRPFRCRVGLIQYGSILLTTEPSGVEVFYKGPGDSSNTAAGRANGQLAIGPLRPGEIELLMLLEGYKPATAVVTLKPGETLPLHYKLELNNSVVMDRPWENGLGMRFVPVEKDLMACIWETRVRDYTAYLVTKKDGVPPPAPDFRQTPDHPVVSVSRREAEAFCEWLTKQEQSQERISVTHIYRLPNDYEWSLMAGLKNELPEASPARRDTLRREIFPWGAFWPPGADGIKAGNLADVSAIKGSIDPSRIIAGYDDGFPYTSPVGSFPPNKLGIYDLCGNVQEWVADPYSTGSSYGVLRGGGWKTYEPQHLYLGSRNLQLPDNRDNVYGFRVVLARQPMVIEKSPEETTPPSDD